MKIVPFYKQRDWITCPLCKGRGRVMQANTAGIQGLVVPKGGIPCPQCDGKKVVLMHRPGIRRLGWPN